MLLVEVLGKVEKIASLEPGWETERKHVRLGRKGGECLEGIVEYVGAIGRQKLRVVVEGTVGLVQLVTSNYKQ